LTPLPVFQTTRLNILICILFLQNEPVRGFTVSQMCSCVVNQSSYVRLDWCGLILYCK